NCLSKFYIYIVILALFLCSCGDSEGNSSVEDAFANQSDFYSSESSDLSNEVFESSDSSIFEDENISETPSEEVLTTEQKLENALKNTFTDEKTIYNMKAVLSVGETSSALENIYMSNGSFVSSKSSIFSNGIEIDNRNDFYLNDSVYIEDNILGKSKFPCDKEYFLNYVENELFYYKHFDHSQNITETEDNNFEYEFSSSVLESKAIKLLSDSLSIKNLVFDNGKCILYVNDENENVSLNNISATISAKYEFEENIYDVIISLTISPIGEIEEPIPNEEEYTNFSDETIFSLSKSFYNLASSNAYEISSETRIYQEEKNSKSYSDIFTTFSSSFSDDKTALGLNITLKNNAEYIFEKYIHNNEEYTRSYKLTSKIPNYKISPSNTDYSSFDTIAEWNPFPFVISDISEYSISETSLYYIIKYSYTNEASISLINAYRDYYKKLYPEQNIISSDDLSNYETTKAFGTLTIRKSDKIVVESSFEVLTTYKNKKSIRIINKTEVIALSEDVLVLTPKK
ncbi:MAG: hypothetical protein J6V36_02810, partial [Clostridia bacterium]|nr:hypothetical protein [Clostridia bacterium]